MEGDGAELAVHGGVLRVVDIAVTKAKHALGVVGFCFLVCIDNYFDHCDHKFHQNLHVYLIRHSINQH